MISELISKRFAVFIIDHIENNKRSESEGVVINEGSYMGIKVVVIENNDNLSGILKTLKGTYIALLIEYLDLI